MRSGTSCLTSRECSRAEQVHPLVDLMNNPWRGVDVSIMGTHVPMLGPSLQSKRANT